MNIKDVVKIRLQNQLLLCTAFTQPHEVVEHFTAVQAQDYLGALWGVGQRMKYATESLIEQAITERTIVRTWPMRGTLHFVAAQDAKWMLKLLTPRVFARAQTIYKQAGLNKSIITKARKVIEKSLSDSQQMTRDELYQQLEKAKISTDQQRGLHILGHVAQEQLICFGPRKGKQHTFVLLDHWIPKSRELDKEDALAELTLRYFKSHGPATLQDYAWWSGLAPTDAKQGLESIKAQLVDVRINDKLYWSAEFEIPKKSNNVTLLPCYDEYTVAYKDRSPVLNPAHALATRNGIFSQVVVINGQLSGTWTRSLHKNGVTIDVNYFEKVSASNAKAITTRVKEYSSFLGVPLVKLNFQQ